jgi:transcriptional regulator with XRE-family HTH domain
MKKLSWPDELRRWRKQMGYTQVKAAKFLGVSHGAFTKYEAGTRTPHHLAMPELRRRMRSK